MPIVAITSPKHRHRATNSAAYDAAMRQRGSLTVWFTDTAIAAWRAELRTSRGGQRHYSALPIATALTLPSVFRLALRQTEGLIGSIIAVLGSEACVVVPPRSSSVPSETVQTASTMRDRHLQMVTERRRMARQKASSYNWRALVEADNSRFKRVIGDGLRSRTDQCRATEVATAVSALNRMPELGRPIRPSPVTMARYEQTAAAH